MATIQLGSGGVGFGAEASYAAYGGTTPPADPVTLATPSGLTASPVSATAINVSWEAVPNALNYKLWENGAVIYTGPNTQVSRTGLTPVTSYAYEVQALGNGTTYLDSTSSSSYTTSTPSAQIGPPSGAQPLSWLQATTSGAMQDYRGAGYATVTGSLPVSTAYAGGKKAWVLDRSAIKLDNLGLENTNQLTILSKASFIFLGEQQYLFTYGGGSNSIDNSFDAYTSSNQLFYRVKTTDGGQATVGSTYLSSNNGPNNMAFMVNFNQIRPASNLDETGDVMVNPSEIRGSNWSKQILYVGQGEGSSIPVFAGSLLRSFLVFGVALTPAKVAEWHAYLDMLP